MYRILVPAVLAKIPIDPTLRWKSYRWGAVVIAGSIVALTVLSASGATAAVLASVLAQGSYGFAFTAYDPFSPDPFVFVCLGLMTWCWLRDRWLVALVVGMVGLFAKETVVLMAVAISIASIIPPRRLAWAKWCGQGPALVGLLLVYRWAYDEYVGWGHSFLAGSIQNSVLRGGWLSLWMQGNSPSTQAFLVFSVFAASWIFAVVGLRRAHHDLRALAIGAAVPFLALVYVQNPERALGNLFFIVIPLAVRTLAGVPFWLAAMAATTSTVLSVRTATMNDWLPSAKYTVPVATLVGALVLWKYFSERRAADSHELLIAGKTTSAATADDGK